VVQLPFDPPLIPGTLIRRYKRFLVDVRLQHGEQVVAHTPNTGSMTGCSDPGSRVFLSRSPNPGRKLPLTLEIVQTKGGVMVGVNTLLPNRLMHHALLQHAVPELAGYDAVRREVAVGPAATSGQRAPHSRLDLMLGRSPPLCYVEIKNVTLVLDGAAAFPDAVTTRGRRHLTELETLAQKGHRAVILFLVQRADCDSLRPADDIDPEYGAALRQAVCSGVEPLAYQAAVSPAGIGLWRAIPVEL